jgi:predicted nucleic acid-binding Zn ribbon protein
MTSIVGLRTPAGKSGAMAVYEFECAACGERFEVTVPITEHQRLKERSLR